MRKLIAVLLLVAACGGSSDPDVDARTGGADGSAVDGASGADGAAAADATPVTADASADEQLCTSTGGTVATVLCCGATPDLVDMCAIGACGCAPGSSHDTRQCQCGGARCYDPELGCVDR